MSRSRPIPISSTTLPPDFESQARANILAQPLSLDADLGTIADLNLPYEFLSRLADRVLRASFYENFRAVVGDPVAPQLAQPLHPTPPPGATSISAPTSIALSPAPLAHVVINEPSLAPDQVAVWLSFSESPPALASFRSPAASGTHPPDAAVAVVDAVAVANVTLLTAQRTSRKHLARDGLLIALARVIAALGPASVLSHPVPACFLLSAGIPVDLLAFFRPDFAPPLSTPTDIIRTLADRLAQGEPLDKLIKSLKRSKFLPAASLPGFRPTSGSGRDTIHLLRAHATRATYYAAPGDGGNLDLLSCTLAALPSTPCIIVTETPNAQPLREALALAPRTATTTISSQPIKVSQWAADNAKPGTLSAHPAHLAPRFASRGEYHPAFVPGDDLAAQPSQPSHPPHIRSARSPLLFQGGNLLVVDDLPRSRRVLLIGEAEIHRNRALGLSTDQTLAFFQTEFAADTCEVLPAASYHIDQEVTVRSTPDATLAFFPEPLAGAIAIIESSLVALADADRWPLELVEQALAHLRAFRGNDAMPLIATALSRERTTDLTYPIALAHALSTGPADSGIGNLHRFLLALDHLVAAILPISAIPEANLAALLRSFHRRAADRAKLRTILTRLGWKPVPVPALPEESRGVNPFNGIHTPDTYLMPAYGGLFSPLDQMAATAFRHALSPSIAVIPIPTAESQRRDGALHCALACYGH